MKTSHLTPNSEPIHLDAPINLSDGERTVLVRGSLRLMLSRVDAGIPLYVDDLIRIAAYVDDDRGRVAR